ncbi:hypothetical protein D3C80_1369810 [compost metagenome]
MLQRHITGIVLLQIIPDILHKPAVRGLAASLGQPLQHGLKLILPIPDREESFFVIAGFKADFRFRPPALQDSTQRFLMAHEAALCQHRQPAQPVSPLGNNPLHPLHITG